MAVEELLDGIEAEAGRLFRMERTQADPPRPGLAKLSPPAHDLDHVRRGDDLFDGRALDQCHASAKRSVIPDT
jgi:hypothetical protein